MTKSGTAAIRFSTDFPPNAHEENGNENRLPTRQRLRGLRVPQAVRRVQSRRPRGGHDRSAARTKLTGKQGKEVVRAERGIDEVKPDDFDALFLPGGSPRTASAPISGWSTSQSVLRPRTPGVRGLPRPPAAPHRGCGQGPDHDGLEDRPGGPQAGRRQRRRQGGRCGPEPRHVAAAGRPRRLRQGSRDAQPGRRPEPGKPASTGRRAASAPAPV